MPQCTNTFTITCEKRYFNIPTKPKTRRKWLQLTRENPEAENPKAFGADPFFFLSDLINVSTDR